MQAIDSKHYLSLRVQHDGGDQSVEWLASIAIERLARKLGIAVNLDDPEQVLIEAVVARVEQLLSRP